jgi:hypothetical protein
MLKPSLFETGYLDNLHDVFLMHLLLDSKLSTTDPGHGHSSTQNFQLDDIVPTYWNVVLYPTNCMTGFLVHENCYKLLKSACHPRPINVETFNLLLCAFGIPRSQNDTVVGWSHIYGGLHNIRDAQTRDIDYQFNLTFEDRIHDQSPWFEQSFKQIQRSTPKLP